MKRYHRGRYRFLQDCVVEERLFEEGRVVSADTPGLTLVQLEALLASGRVCRVVALNIETKKDRP